MYSESIAHKIYNTTHVAHSAAGSRNTMQSKYPKLNPSFALNALSKAVTFDQLQAIQITKYV